MTKALVIAVVVYTLIVWVVAIVVNKYIKSLEERDENA